MGGNFHCYDIRDGDCYDILMECVFSSGEGSNGPCLVDLHIFRGKQKILCFVWSADFSLVSLNNNFPVVIVHSKNSE